MYRKKPKRIVTFAKYEWLHWLIIIIDFILGITVSILPSFYCKKVLIGPLIIGIICISIGIFSIIDQIIYRSRLKKWKKDISKDR